MGRKLKQPKYKINPETPDKPKNSEIFKMFEKCKHKKEQKMIREPQGIGYLENEKNDDLNTDTLPADSAKNCSKSTINLSEICADKLIGKSPKLKPQNRSTFAELRSIFEGGGLISQHEVDPKDTSSKSQVERLNFDSKMK